MFFFDKGKDFFPQQRIRTPFVVVEQSYIEAHYTELFRGSDIVFRQLYKTVYKGKSYTKEDAREEENPLTSGDPYTYKNNVQKHKYRSENTQGGILKVARRYKGE